MNPRHPRENEPFRTYNMTSLVTNHIPPVEYGSYYFVSFRIQTVAHPDHTKPDTPEAALSQTVCIIFVISRALVQYHIYNTTVL